MTRWDRVGFSLLSAIIVDVTLAFVFSVPDNANFLEHIFGFLYFASVLILPGWLIALPILVIPKKAAYLPKWQLGLIGTSIGPCVMVAIGIYAAIANHTGFGYKREAWYLVVVATIVAGLTTALYLKFLKHFS